jgi:serine/threonine protein phosphatase PrpC
MKYVSSSSTSKGLSYSQNEDHFLVKEGIGLHVVCDGSGEEDRGAMASRMATDFLDQVFSVNKKLISEYEHNPSDELKLKIMTLIDQAVHKVSNQIKNTISKDFSRRQMGTTLSMVLVIGKSAFLAHVGDSRVYLLRATKFHQLTEDHVAKQRSSQLASSLEIQGIKGSSLTRLLGMTDVLKVDLLFFEIMPGDFLLLFTDGVSDNFDKINIQTIIKTTPETELAKTILKAILKLNLKDNATAISICFEQDIEKEKTVDTMSPQYKILALQQIPLFSELDYKEITKLVDLMDFKRIQSNNNAVVENENGSELYIILSGTANVLVNNVIVTQLEPGNYFGEMSLIDDEPRSATVTATTDLEVLTLDKKTLSKLVLAEPKMSIKILWRFSQTLTARVRLMNLRGSITQKEKTQIDDDLLTKTTIKFDY